MLATPAELSEPLQSLAGPSSALLSDPLATTLQPREAVWAALEHRLDAREQAENERVMEAWEEEKTENGEEMEEIRQRGELADRLRRREGKMPERVAQSEETAVSDPSTSSKARYLLDRLVEMAPKEGEADVTVEEGAGAHDEVALLHVPRGIAVREEWRSLLHACVGRLDGPCVRQAIHCR